MKRPKDILVKRRDYQTLMVVFDEGNNKLFSGTFDSFGKVGKAIHALAWEAAKHRHGLELLPLYPAGDGYFIWRVQSCQEKARF